MSVSGALAYRWDGKRSRIFFQTTPDNFNAAKLIGFLKNLKRELRGRRCLLVWDGLAAHKSREMKAFLINERAWLQTEMLPGYSPDLNPVESLWGNIKGQELANRCGENLGEMAAALRGGMRRARRKKSLSLGFLRHAGLFF